jgi:hypothetical protein
VLAATGAGFAGAGYCLATAGAGADCWCWPRWCWPRWCWLPLVLATAGAGYRWCWLLLVLASLVLATAGAGYCWCWLLLVLATAGAGYCWCWPRWCWLLLVLAAAGVGYCWCWPRWCELVRFLRCCTCDPYERHTAVVSALSRCSVTGAAVVRWWVREDSFFLSGRISPTSDSPESFSLLSPLLSFPLAPLGWTTLFPSYKTSWLEFARR